MAAILQTEALSRRFGAVTAADNVSVSIGRGEIVGVIGANGAGKTTFINMVTGYLPPSSGHIRFDGRDIRGLGPRQLQRRGLARSFQTAQLFLELTATENLLLALAAADKPGLSMIRPYRTAAREAEARRILARLDIAGHADEPITAMPQGARKLLDIAMAMVGEPRMLLLDEPTSGVSVEEKYALMDRIMRVVREQLLTVLFVEHDMDIVQRYVSRILAFAQGAVIADGTPEQVMSDARVRQLITGTDSAVRPA